jgi:poly(glycerol-phosphate) alpha-glucosyltransferase
MPDKASPIPSVASDAPSAPLSAFPSPASRLPLAAFPLLFTGPAFGEQKDQLLRAASAFILPSFSEGLPMSVLEAWAYGLPVLMTDHCNLPEGFANNAAIRIGTDVESIAAGLRTLFAAPTSAPPASGLPPSQSLQCPDRPLTSDLRPLTPDLQSLGRNGRALVERQFTWPQVARQTQEVYDWVLGQGPKPDFVSV